MVFVSDRDGNQDVLLYHVTTQTVESTPGVATSDAEVEPSIPGNGRAEIS